MTKNFKIVDKDTGKEYWVSRSVAVTCIIVGFDSICGPFGNVSVLLEKRGSGCPDNVGKLCAVCGYLDYNETIEEAVIREVYEETGLEIEKEDLRFWKIISDPKENNQNVIIRFYVFVPTKDLEEGLKTGKLNTKTEERGGEKDEVDELKLYSLSEINEISPENFAFNHKEMIKECIWKS